MKKVLCAALAALAVTAMLVMSGCQNGSGPSGNSNDSLYNGEELNDGLPDIKFNNEPFRVIITTDHMCTGDIYTEDHETGDPLHDAVFRRNANVCERFGIKIEVYDQENSISAVSTSVKAGSDEYDLAFVGMVYGSELAQENLVLPFHKLPYVNLEQPWWDKDIWNGFSIRNNLMMVNGDISPSSFSVTSCLFFNKTLLDKLDIQHPYELVRQGKWTLDRLYEITKDATVDLDGDLKATPDSDMDRFGLAAWCLDAPYSFYYAAGGMLVSKDRDDVPYYNADLERDTLIYNKIYNVVIKNNAYFETDLDFVERVGQTFLEGRALFYDATLSTAEILREMDDEYGFVPVPKFDELQSEYKSFVNGGSAMLCVPATVPESRREFVSIIIEALASEASRTVTPVLKENYLKRKITRDADSADMIDYIVKHRVYDMAYINMHLGVGSYVKELLTKKATDISSTLKNYQKVSEKKIQLIVKAFDKSLNS